ncbi:MAG: serine hydrolase domain-containing protein [Desulfosalsimonas sp.]|uniref:serine hydrolase domain-containing protein n=1 Tax=Desulfosalsimonas sp. TaxID=3073848 RepID=UPI003970C095
MKQADALMQEAVDTGVFPGAVALVARNNEIVFHKGFGWLDHFKNGLVYRNTVYDLASLTKPLSTAAAAMHLSDRGILDLNDRLGTLLPGLDGSDKAGISVENLLCHNAGLPAWRPYFRELNTLPADRRKKRLHQLLAKEPLVCPPGRKTLYSDVGFMLLQWVLEKVAGTRLDGYVSTNLYLPLNISDLFFLPDWGKISSVPADRAFAASGVDENNRAVYGRVNDENARAMGGVAGHAGLFGTAAAVFYFLCHLLEIRSGTAEKRLFSRAVVERFLTIPPGAGRTPGFDVPEAQNSSSGRFFPRDTSVGHLGYTGTSFWIELRREIMVILLSNRVCTDPESRKIKDFRPRFHDAVINGLKT